MHCPGRGFVCPEITGTIQIKSLSRFVPQVSENSPMLNWIGAKNGAK
jgi:hypothetical protein